MLIALFACGLASGPAPALGEYGTIPAFSLTDQTGTPRTAGDFAGKVLVVDFIFTSCPDICPTLTANMAEVSRHYAGNPDVHFLSFSVDPGTDTPPVLATYGAKYGADPARWSFLTGPLDLVRSAVVDGFKQVMVETGGTDEPRSVLHGSRFVIVDRTGQMRAFVDAAEPGKTELYRAVDTLLGEPPKR